MSGKQGVERGAAEEQSETPLTETEVRASQRPAGQGDQPIEPEPAQRMDKDVEADEERRRAQGT